MSTKIYLITNKSIDPEMYYVGKTKLSLDERFSQHIRMGSRENNQLLHEAILEYGKRNFTIQLLEEIEDEHAAAIENLYIKKYLSHHKDGKGYNMRYETADNVNKNYHGADYQIIKTNIDNGFAWNRGVNFSEKSKNKISQTRKHRFANGLYTKYGHLHTEETKKKLSEIAKQRSTPSVETRQKLSEKSSNRFCIYNADEKQRKFIKKGSDIPDGWIIGKGACWVNDGKKSYSIDIWEETEYTKLGYVRGRLGNVVRNH